MENVLPISWTAITLFSQPLPIDIRWGFPRRPTGELHLQKIMFIVNSQIVIVNRKQ